MSQDTINIGIALMGLAFVSEGAIQLGLAFIGCALILIGQYRYRNHAEPFVSRGNPYNQPPPSLTQAQEFALGKKAYSDEVFSLMKVF
jgi:hypothetical protein